MKKNRMVITPEGKTEIETAEIEATNQTETAMEEEAQAPGSQAAPYPPGLAAGGNQTPH